MAKNRFNTRASWDSSFRNTGQIMPRYSPPKNKSKKIPKYKTKGQIEKIDFINTLFYSKMNEWEQTFINSVTQVPFRLSEKQEAILNKMAQKYKHLIPND